MVTLTMGQKWEESWQPEQLKPMIAWCWMHSEITNITKVMEFLVLGFSEVWELRPVHDTLFLPIYLASRMGNLLITILDYSRGYASTPKSRDSDHQEMSNHMMVMEFLLLGFSEVWEMCLVHYVLFLLFYFVALAGNLLIIAVIAHEWRLHTLMSLTTVIHTAGTFSPSFCGSNYIHQFFCGIPQLPLIYCSQETFGEVVPIIKGIVLDFWCFLVTGVSYIFIFTVILKISTVECRSKTFATCLPNLAIIILFFFGFFSYFKSPSDFASMLDLLVSLYYMVEGLHISLQALVSLDVFLLLVKDS
ncbi:olfactory receptor 14A16-like [Tachyglossus aculeatus]|uniref:olfactory receptor 14A16-like n=1 Tax=Tachyglossus aculeatus TaxID=9261 RepID=UPI0018F3940F|nr:olfactory receptor 14A16-like [Tachyglossus aculeatus]